MIFQVVSHASETEMRYLEDAFEAKLSPKTLGAFIERVPELTKEITSLIFPKCWVEYWEEKTQAYQASNSEGNLTQAFIRKYWAEFQDKPKPFLLYNGTVPDDIVIKVMDRAPEHFSIFTLVGTASEKVLSHYLDKEDKSFDHNLTLEHALLCGYSEEIILRLIERFTGKSSDAKAIAQLRGYSENVVQELNKLTPSWGCTIS